MKKLIATFALIPLIQCGEAGSPPRSELADDPVRCCNEASALLEGIPGKRPIASGPLKLAPGVKQLFLDNYLLSRLENVERKVRQPKKYGAVIRQDKTWEGTIQTRTGPSWNPEKNLWMLWYFAEPGPAYATSRDGVQWEKPVLGVEEFRGSWENNLLPKGLTFIFYDPRDRDPGRRYKAFAGEGSLHSRRGGFYPAVSADGLKWTVLRTSFIPSQDEANLFHDEQTNLFLATVKHGGPYGRSVYLSVSKDFEHWTDPRDCLMFHADRRDQELGAARIERRFADPTLKHPEYNTPVHYNVDVYNMAVFRYGDVYIGLPALFHHTGKVPKDWEGFQKMKLSDYILGLVHQYGDYTGFHHLQLTSSRDLCQWERVGGRQPFIDSSKADSGAYDLQTIMPASRPAVRGDEIWFYYTGIKQYAFVTSGRPDAGAICLAKLPLDRFVSLEAADAEGRVLTRPVVIQGNSLHLNIAAPNGEVRVEILDPTRDEALPGLSKDDCIPAGGDRLDAEVRWKGGAGIRSLAGRAVRLRFLLRNAGLYAFWTKD